MTAPSAGFSKDAQDAVYAESFEPHKIKLIDHGALSLYERLSLIKSAKKSLELEFFIFNIDKSSRLVTQALLEKAKEGVQIRLLVDFSAPVFQLRPAYAKLMSDAGIQVKYYNTSAMYKLFTVQHRSHRKLLIVDGQSVLTGGRNIADDYFDLSDHYNFLDSDVLLTGPLVKTIQSSFNLYWNSDLVAEPKAVEKEILKLDLDNAMTYLTLREEDITTLEKLEKLKSQNTDHEEHTCNDTIFVTDFPGAGESHRKIYSTIIKLISEAKTSVLIESPYFVLRQEGYDSFKNMIDRKLNVTVLTNGLFSTDAFYVISPLLLNLNWIAEIGLDLYLYQGKPLKTNSVPTSDQEIRWGIHAKRAVLDEQTVLIGTYNIDPRSANLNSELMIVCKNNPAFAKQVLQSIQGRLDQSTLIISDKKVLDKDALMKNAPLKQKIMTYLAIPFATSFDFIL